MLCISSEINASHSATEFEPFGFACGRFHDVFGIFPDKGDGVGRAGRDADAAADAFVLKDHVAVFAFFNGVDLAAFILADAATDADGRINLGVVVGVYGLVDAQFGDGPEHATTASAAVADVDMAVFVIAGEVDEARFFRFPKHFVGFFLGDGPRGKGVILENAGNGCDGEADFHGFVASLAQEFLFLFADAVVHGKGLAPLDDTGNFFVGHGDLGVFR